MQWFRVLSYPLKVAAMMVSLLALQAGFTVYVSAKESSIQISRDTGSGGGGGGYISYWSNAEFLSAIVKYTSYRPYVSYPAASSLGFFPGNDPTSKLTPHDIFLVKGRNGSRKLKFKDLVQSSMGWPYVNSPEHVYLQFKGRLGFSDSKAYALAFGSERPYIHRLFVDVRSTDDEVYKYLIKDQAMLSRVQTYLRGAVKSLGRTGVAVGTPGSFQLPSRVNVNYEIDKYLFEVLLGKAQPEQAVKQMAHHIYLQEQGRLKSKRALKAVITKKLGSLLKEYSRHGKRARRASYKIKRKFGERAVIVRVSQGAIKQKKLQFSSNLGRREILVREGIELSPRDVSELAQFADISKRDLQTLINVLNHYPRYEKY